MKKLEKYASLFAYVILGFVVAVVAVFLKSPLLFVIGGLLFVSNLLEVLILLGVRKDPVNDDGPGIGCAVSAFPIIGLCILAMVYSHRVHISALGDERHEYADCDKKMDKNVDYEVCEFSAMLCGCFTKCEKCAERLAIETEVQEKEEMEERRKEALDFIQDQIDELLYVRQAILVDSEDVDIQDYEFRYQCEDEILEIKDELDDPSLRY